MFSALQGTTYGVRSVICLTLAFVLLVLSLRLLRVVVWLSVYSGVVVSDALSLVLKFIRSATDILIA
jgi:hypothetical protein